jgi:hypothetical protein
MIGGVVYIGVAICTAKYSPFKFTTTNVSTFEVHQAQPIGASCANMCQPNDFCVVCHLFCSVVILWGPTGLNLHRVADFDFCKFLYPLNALGILRDTIVYVF